MNWKNEWKALLLMVIIFLGSFYLPVESHRFTNAILESLRPVKWYAREHVLLCLVPAFFIAGAIAVFISQASVMKYLGARANKILACGVASVSGTILAVCSCTVPPLFAGIYRTGEGQEAPLSGRIAWRVIHPEREPEDEKERSQKEKLEVRRRRIRRAVEERNRRENKS